MGRVELPSNEILAAILHTYPNFVLADSIKIRKKYRQLSGMPFARFCPAAESGLAR